MADQTLEVALNLIATGNGAQLTKSHLEAVSKAAEEVSASGRKAYEALKQIDQAPTQSAQRAEALRQEAEATEAIAAARKRLVDAGYPATWDQQSAGPTPPAEQMSAQDLKAYQGAIGLISEGFLEEKMRRIDEAIAMHNAIRAAENDKALAAELKRIDKHEQDKQRLLEKFQRDQAKEAEHAAAQKAKAEEDAAKRAAKARTTYANAEEQTRQKKILNELQNAQADETKETEKATSKKTDLRHALQGLNTEFPALGQVIRAAISPIGLTAAASALLTRAVLEQIRVIDEAAAKAREFETFGDRVNPVEAMRVSMEGARDAMVRDLNAIEDAASSVVERLREANDALDDAKRKEEKIDDEKTKRDIQRVRTAVSKGEMSREAGDAAIAAIENEARQRKEQRDIQYKKDQSNNYANAALQSRVDARKAQEEYDALSPQVIAARQAAAKAAANESKVARVNTEEIAKNDKIIGTLKEFAAGKGQTDPVMLGKAVFGVLGGNLSDYAGIANPKNAEQAIARLQERNAGLIREQEQSSKLAAQESERQKSVEAQQEDARRRATEANRNVNTFTKQAQRAYDSAVSEEKTVAEIAPIRNESQTLIQQQRAAESFNRERARREQEAARVIRSGGSAPGFDYNYENGRATMQIVEQERLTNELLRQLLRSSSDRSTVVREAAQRESHNRNR